VATAESLSTLKLEADISQNSLSSSGEFFGGYESLQKLFLDIPLPLTRSIGQSTLSKEWLALANQLRSTFISVEEFITLVRCRGLNRPS
jgi:hypothetical protein